MPVTIQRETRQATIYRPVGTGVPLGLALRKIGWKLPTCEQWNDNDDLLCIVVPADKTEADLIAAIESLSPRTSTFISKIIISREDNMSTENSKLLFHIKARCILNSNAYVTSEGKLSFDQKEAMPFASGPDALIYLAKLIWNHRREDLGGQTFLVVDSNDKYYHGVSLS